jgi:hypothetical protein
MVGAADGGAEGCGGRTLTGAAGAAAGAAVNLTWFLGKMEMEPGADLSQPRYQFSHSWVMWTSSPISSDSWFDAWPVNLYLAARIGQKIRGIYGVKGIEKIEEAHTYPARKSNEKKSAEGGLPRAGKEGYVPMPLPVHSFHTLIAGECAGNKLQPTLHTV